MKVLVADIGNSNIVIGVYDDKELLFTSRIPTTLASGMVSALQKSISDFLHAEEIDPSSIDGAIISSVVPVANIPLKTAIERLIHRSCLIVDHNMKTNIVSFDYDLHCLGIDRIVDISAAIDKYGVPVQVFDLGTCTTMSVVDANGCFQGGTISAGVQLSLNTMGERAAQLPPLHAETCDTVIGKDVISCMQNGTVIGTAAMIDGLILRSKNELHLDNLTTVLTGGLCSLVQPHCQQKVYVEKNLLLDGLRLVYELNRPE